MLLDRFVGPMWYVVKDPLSPPHGQPSTKRLYKQMVERAPFSDSLNGEVFFD